MTKKLVTEATIVPRVKSHITLRVGLTHLQRKTIASFDSFDKVDQVILIDVDIDRWESKAVFFVNVIFDDEPNRIHFFTPF